MRIGIITGEFPPLQGGVGAYTQRLAEHLIAQGQDVYILSTEVTDTTDERIHLSSIIARWNARAWLQARAWTHKNRLDIISLQYQTAAFGMSPFIHFFPDVLRPIPVVTTFHDLRFPYLFPRAGSLRTWIVQRLARASTACITTNSEDEAQLVEIPQTTTIPIGSNLLVTAKDESKRQKLYEKLRVTEDDFLIAYFGLVNRSKGLDILLNSIVQLRSSHIPAQLVIIGGTAGASDPTNQMYSDEIKWQIEESGLQHLVHITGYVDDEAAGEYLQAVDVVALPFRDGASSRRGSLLAALQHGCAIVTTNPTTPTSEFIDGETMLHVPAEDIEALTSALKRLHDDPLLRERIGAGAQKASQRFDWTSIAQAHIQCFAHVLEQLT